MHLPGLNNNKNSRFKELIKRTFTGILIAIVIFYNLLNYPKIFSLLILFSALIILKQELPLICSNIFNNIKYNNIKNKLFFYFISLFYIIVPFILIIYFELSKYKILNLYLFSLVFAHDSGSYVFGNLFGYHKLCPKISPKKSIEGAIGGLLSVIAGFLIFNKLKINISFNQIFIFSLLISILALSGDLLESYLKRLANIKDSGNILPGHGGLLDRFDSILLNTYFLYIIKDYLI